MPWINALLISVCLIGSIGQAHAEAPSALTLPVGAREQVLQMSAALKAQWATMVARGQTPATTEEPSLQRGEILTPTVNVIQAPALPAVQLTLNPGTVGIAEVEVYAVSPSGMQYLSSQPKSLPVYPPQTYRFSIPFQIGTDVTGSSLSLYTAPGTWTVNGIELLARDGSLIEYFGPDIQKFFPSVTFNVVNPGTPDVMPPVVGQGHILTPTISLSASPPVFAARVLTADTGSGVASIHIELTPPSGPGFGIGIFASSDLTAPVTLGNIVVSSTISGVPVGPYSIAYLSVCDVAGNCTNIGEAAAIKAMFGNVSVNVTN